MIDFTTLQGLTIPEGVVTQITDESGRVIWAVGGSKVILEVEKITSDTYAGETTYTGEQFILLDIYPKANGTVKVTYGGLTKTITDTSGAAEPNAQQVFFGTFNGVTDSVATASSGELTIDGDYYAFGLGHYARDNSYKKDIVCNCVAEISDMGNIEKIPDSALSGGTKISGAVIIPDSVTSIGEKAFVKCTAIEEMTVPASVTSISDTAWNDKVNGIEVWNGSFLSIDSNNPNYSFKGSCLIEKATNTVISGFSDAVIPQGVKTIGEKAFYLVKGMSANLTIPEGVTTIGAGAFKLAQGTTNITLPSSLTSIGDGAFTISAESRTLNVVVLATTPPVYDTSGQSRIFTEPYLSSITVPAGSGAAYKEADGWDYFSKYIVEAS